MFVDIMNTQTFQDGGEVITIEKVEGRRTIRDNNLLTVTIQAQTPVGERERERETEEREKEDDKMM